MQLKMKFDLLDKWVEKIPVSGYVPLSYEAPESYYGLTESFAIQQCREEIQEFVSLLTSNNKLNNALEIGLGFYGSTHFLWRLIFNSVTTIEKDPKRVREFGDRLANFYDNWLLGDNKSKFIYGFSNETSVVQAAYSLGKVDMLFIDGDHQYKSVLTDYLLYEPLVNSGGIIAFHDTASTNYEHNVPKLIHQLKEGYFGKKHLINDIIFSKSLGISYYVKESE
jgi:predicted O-methyltransferase YrrM